MSFLGDFVGGAAEAGAGIIGNQIKVDQETESRERLARLNNELETERQKTIAQTKIELEEQLRQSQQKRTADQFAQIQPEAEKIAKERDLSTANRVAPSVDDKTMGIIKSQLSPEQQQKFYGIKPQTALSNIDDQIAAGNKLGAYDAVDGLRKSRTEAFNDAKQQQALDIAEKKDATARDESARKEVRDEQRHKEAMAHIAAVAGRSNGGEGKITEGERKTYTALMSDASRQIKSARDSLPKIFDEQERAAVQENIKSLQREHDTYASLLAGTQSGKGEKSDPKPDASTSTPPTSALKEGKVTSFANGQKWTIKGGKAVQVN